MSRRRKLSAGEVEKLLLDEENEEQPEPYSASDDSSYVPSDASESERSCDSDEAMDQGEGETEGEAVEENRTEDEVPAAGGNAAPVGILSITDIMWKPMPNDFQPLKTIPQRQKSQVHVPHNSDELAVFLKMFPRSLLMFIAQNTNKRIDIYNRKMRRHALHTDSSEIMIVLGCVLIMSYNHLPSYDDYWSQHTSMGNAAIKAAISRDRFTFLSSKMYFNDPVQPDGSSKTYYIDELISCLKQTFQKYRDDSTFQSIDESMAKFKGRSSLKQFIPNKPIKRGIKLWVRCDSDSGYVYDLNVYSGKAGNQESDEGGTLGEKVVNKLLSTVKEDPEKVAVCFDRFFSHVSLIENTPHPVTATCLKNRKRMPKFTKKTLQKGESEILINEKGVAAFRWQDTKDVIVLSNCHDKTAAFRWQDTKDVIVLSNCHDKTITEVSRREKTGRKVERNCPEAIKFYNDNMGGVDLCDQLVAMYDLNRRSAKWWKKVFYKVLLMAVTNAYVIKKDLVQIQNPNNKKKLKLLDFIVPLAESLVNEGKKSANVTRTSKGGRRASLKKFHNVGEHLPAYESKARKRCVRCHGMQRERRTTMYCLACNTPLCKQCFTIFHQ